VKEGKKNGSECTSKKKNRVGAAKDFISRLSLQSRDQVATNQMGQTGRAPWQKSSGIH
jgi:hypothetical protein